MSDNILKGHNALITGASRGLGKAMALALGAAGAGIALVGRDRPALDNTAAELAGQGARGEVFTADVAAEDQVTRLRDEVLARFPHIDILINNAGINIRKSISEFTFEEWNRVMDTNVNSVFLMCRTFIPQMKGRGFGRIINMTSIMSHVSIAGRTAYSTSKTALLGLTRALALELASEGITVVAKSPGPFGTEMNTPLMQNPEINAQFLSKIPVGRWGRVEEIGQLALYLCSDAAGFITGNDILIDGGWCAQ